MLALDNISGIPAHPLVVHIPVVLIPLGFVLAVAAMWKRFRTQLLIAAAVAAGLILIYGLAALAMGLGRRRRG